MTTVGITCSGDGGDDVRRTFDRVDHAHLRQQEPGSLANDNQVHRVNLFQRDKCHFARAQADHENVKFDGCAMHGRSEHDLSLGFVRWMIAIQSHGLIETSDAENRAAESFAMRDLQRLRAAIGREDGLMARMFGQRLNLVETNLTIERARVEQATVHSQADNGTQVFGHHDAGAWLLILRALLSLA